MLVILYLVNCFLEVFIVSRENYMQTWLALNERCLTIWYSILLSFDWAVFLVVHLIDWWFWMKVSLFVVVLTSSQIMKLCVIFYWMLLPGWGATSCQYLQEIKINQRTRFGDKIVLLPISFLEYLPVNAWFTCRLDRDLAKMYDCDHNNKMAY
jgi:hypothetical protein